MKTIRERIRLEKQMWLDLFRHFERLGYYPKWEIASKSLSRQKIWSRIDSYHQGSTKGFYGFAFTVSRIGNHDLQFCVEMQDELKFGLRFREGFPYWTENEIESWGELTLRLDGQSKWQFDLPGWFASKKLPVRLRFNDSENPAMIDLAIYKDDSYAKLLIVDQLMNALAQIKTSSTHTSNKKYGTYIN